jgi:hypothetical protein
MESTLKTKVKAETIATAIFTATGIKPDVIYRPDRAPLITFTRENGRKMENFLTAQIKKKSDVDIDLLPVIQPAIIKNILPYIVTAALVFFVSGFLVGKSQE